MDQRQVQEENQQSNEELFDQDNLMDSDSIGQEATIQDILNTDQSMEQVFLGLCDKLQSYLLRQHELTDKIEELTKEIHRANSLKRQPNPTSVKRLGILRGQKKQVDGFIEQLEIKTQEMMKGQEKFRVVRDQALQQYYQKKQDRRMDEEEKEQEEQQIKEDMKIIEAKAQEIEAFNNRNFKVDEDFLVLFQPLFDKYESEIVNAPYHEFTEDQPPSYFPQKGVWFNNEDKQMSSPPQAMLSPTEKQELENELQLISQELPQRSATVAVPKGGQNKGGLFSIFKKNNIK